MSEESEEPERLELPCMAWLPLRSGGRDAVALVMPPIMRRYALMEFFAEARGDIDRPGEEVADSYQMQCLLNAAVALSIEGGLEEFGRRIPPDLQVVGERAADFLYARGVDVMHSDYMELGTRILDSVVDSLDIDTEAEEDAKQEALAGFQEPEEENS